MIKSRKPHRTNIPIPFLLQMGNYEDISLHGVKTIVHVIDCAAGVDKHIAEMRSRLECSTKVVGIDYKEMKYNAKVLVLYALGHGLIIHLGYVQDRCKAPESLDNFLSDPKICFVGLKLPQNIYCFEFSNANTAVKAGDLAARVLKKPGVSVMSLSNIAKEVGVTYEGPDSASGGTVLEVDSSNSQVFTEELVKKAMNDAIAYYQIGYKLLTSL